MNHLNPIRFRDQRLDIEAAASSCGRGHNAIYSRLCTMSSLGDDWAGLCSCATE